MPRRFHAPGLDLGAAEYVLDGNEAHHLLSVTRIRRGEEVELIDGTGGWARAELLDAGRRSARLRILASGIDEEPEGIAIACALPKGDRATTLVEKLAELGVARLVPLSTSRSVVEPGEGKRARWARTAIEACKQSGRRRFMEIAEPATWKEWSASAAPGWIVDPAGEVAINSLAGEKKLGPFAIGPEGGWSDEEVALGRERGWGTVRLPGHVLRVETASIAIAAWARFRDA